MPYQGQGQGQVRSLKVITNYLFNGVCAAHDLWAVLFIECKSDTENMIRLNVRSQSGRYQVQVKIGQHFKVVFQSKSGVYLLQFLFWIHWWYFCPCRRSTTPQNAFKIGMCCFSSFLDHFGKTNQGIDSNLFLSLNIAFYKCNNSEIMCRTYPIEQVVCDDL